MSIAEKMNIIAENTQRVYEAGQDSFWDRYQDNGNRENYDYAFAGDGWTDEMYNPKYPINAESFQAMFYENKNITNTKVPIILGDNSNNSQSDATFYNCRSLVTVPSLTVGKNTFFFGTFDYCEALEYIGFQSDIWCDIYLQESPNLTDEALRLLVQRLKDFNNDALPEGYSTPGIYLENDVSQHIWEITMDERCPEYEGMVLGDVIIEKGWSC